MSTPNDESAPRWAQRLAGNNPVLTRTLLLVAAACTAIPVTVAIVYREKGLWAQWPVLAWGTALALVFFGAALLSFAYHPAGVTQTERVRLLLMAALGLAGLFTTLLGFLLPFTAYWGLLGDMASWRDNIGPLLKTVGAAVGGLAVMFVSLALVGGMERGNQFVRWLVYGFNAVLGTLLLACALAVLNVLLYMDAVDQAFGRLFSRDFDFTRTSMYTLNDKTERFLASMEQKVTAYVMLARRSVLQEDLETLMRNFQAHSPNFRWKLVVADTPQGRTKIVELMKKYGTAQDGILLISGDEDGKSDSEFVPMRRMISTLPTPRGGREPAEPQEAFTGENAVLAGLTSLLEGKVKVYFTQGHGEMSLSPHGAGMLGAGELPSGSASELKSELEKTRSRLTVEPLKLGTGGVKEVPKDASVVVIARPTRPWSPAELKVLGDYLSRKEERSRDGKVTVTAGRLVALLPPVVAREGDSTRLVKTGLESFLATYGVTVGDERVQSLMGEEALKPLCLTNPTASCPVGRAFCQPPRAITWFPMPDARTVAPGRAQAYTAEVLLMARPPYWLEKNFARDPDRAADALRRNQKVEGAEVELDQPAPVGVVVTEGGAMGRFGASNRGRPVMAVFGASEWVSDAGLKGAEGKNNLSLFVSCLSWVREQADIGELVPAKPFDDYKLVVPEGSAVRLIFMPLALMCLGVAALGIGVWVVRRS